MRARKSGTAFRRAPPEHAEKIHHPRFASAFHGDPATLPAHQSIRTPRRQHAPENWIPAFPRDKSGRVCAEIMLKQHGKARSPAP
ncbi:hypothetical protein [Bradyrhizobium sp. JR3.5]